jgi:NAD-dependent dihydropyrimidine dehydrogenase PreA subunit
VTFVITQPCIDTTDQSCVEVCPVDCIHFEEGVDRMLYINPLECIDCGACQPACPVNAIFPQADVPAGSEQFTVINELWYDNPDAARAQVAGGGAAPAAAAAAAPGTAAAQPTAATPGPTESAASFDTAEAAAGEPAAAAAPAAAPATPAAAVAAMSSQVEVEPEEAHGPVVVPHYNPPSPVGLVAFAGMAISFILMWLTPGPNWLEIAGVDLHAGIVIFAPIFAVCALAFLGSQFHDLSLFASRQPRSSAYWRKGMTDWRRSESMRRYDLERAVQELVESRFSFPSPSHPTYRTHVNVPEPTMALEFGGGGGQKVFPDILVVDYPGNYPVIVAQVETRETVTRDQARRVWKQLENDEAPLYIYVPTGLGAMAKDYARSAGIKHVRFRTWRNLPTGMMVEDI